MQKDMNQGSPPPMPPFPPQLPSPPPPLGKLPPRIRGHWLVPFLLAFAIVGFGICLHRSAPEQPSVADQPSAPPFKAGLDTMRGDWFIVATNPNPEIFNRIVTNFIKYHFAEHGVVTRERTSRGRTETETGSYTFDRTSGLIHTKLDLGEYGVQVTSWQQLSPGEAKTVYWRNLSFGHEHAVNDPFVKEGSAEWDRRGKITF